MRATGQQFCSKLESGLYHISFASSLRHSRIMRAGLVCSQSDQWTSSVQSKVSSWCRKPSRRRMWSCVYSTWFNPSVRRFAGACLTLRITASSSHIQLPRNRWGQKRSKTSQRRWKSAKSEVLFLWDSSLASPIGVIRLFIRINFTNGH